MLDQDITRLYPYPVPRKSDPWFGGGLPSDHQVVVGDRYVRRQLDFTGDLEHDDPRPRSLQGGSQRSCPAVA